jgi:hypothetical protein
VSTNIFEEHTALKIDSVCSSETLVPTYKFMWYHNPEDQHRQIDKLFITKMYRAFYKISLMFVVDRTSVSSDSLMQRICV